MEHISIYYKQIQSTVSQSNCTFSFQKELQQTIHNVRDELFESCLKNYGILNKDYSLDKELNGKPYFRSHPHLHFNISHSTDHLNFNTRSCVAVGFANTRLGIDIEFTRHIKSVAAKNICSKDEYDVYVSHTCPDEYLTRLWTLKEAYCKYTGKGLQTPFHTLHFIPIGNMEHAFIYQIEHHSDVILYQYELEDHLWLSVCTDAHNSSPVQIIKV